MQDLDAKRLYWACRRGMLELDLFLLPFVENVYSYLTKEEQQSLKRLLQATDVELYQWLTGKQQPEEPDFVKLVTRIRDYAYDRAKNKQK